MPAVVSIGYSGMICSAVMPAAKQSRTTLTGNGQAQAVGNSRGSRPARIPAHPRALCRQPLCRADPPGVHVIASVLRL